MSTDNIINAAERTATVPVTGGIASDTTTVTLCAGATTATDPTCGDGTLYTTTPTTGTTWSYTLTTADITALGDVDVTLTVIAADAAGNQAVSAGRDITIDTMAPTTPTIDAVSTDNIINAAERTATVPVTGGIASDTTTVTLCAGATTATDPTCGDGTLYTTTPTTGTTWSYTLTTADITTLGDVDVTLTVIAADAAGNQAVSAGRDITIDTMAPVFPVTPNAADNREMISVITGTATAVYDAAATDNSPTADTGITYALAGADSATFSLATTSGILTPMMTLGMVATYNVEITATDEAGNAVTQYLTINVFEAGISAFEVSMDGTSINTVMIAEASGNDILYVQLASQPAANVTLSVISSDTNEGTVDMAALTFTTANWDDRQAVTVTAVPDEIDRDDSFMVNFMVTTGDSANYTTSLALSVAVTVTDDDTAGLTVDISDGVTTSETGTTDTFTVVLDSQPTANVTVEITELIATEHSLAPSTTLTFTTGNWATAQTITLTGENDNVVDGNQTYNLTLTPSGGGYDSVTAATVSVTNEDDDTAELSIADMTVNEDVGTATVTVTLTPAVTATGNVTVNTMTADGTATAGTDYTAITSQTLTFAAGTTSQTLDITISDDSIVEGSETFTVMLDTLVQPTGVTTVTITDATATVTITDNDTVGLTVVDGGGVTTSETGTTGTFTVVLDSQPTANVTVEITGLIATEHTSVPPTTLMFTTVNWATAQTITLTGVNDNVVDGDQTYNLTLTPTGGGYTGVTAATVSVTNEDDDTAELTIADMMVNENATTATVTVTLTPAVTATGNVTVNAMTVDGTAEAGTDYTAIASQTLTFTAGTTSQTLDITISDDNIAEGSETFTVMLDTLVQPTGVTTVSIATATATVTITDDETAPTMITLGISQPTIPETAGATTITVTATIDGTVVLPTPTVVTVSVGGGTATSGTDYTAVPNFDLTIPAESASGMATFMIDPNASSDNGDTVMITGTAPSFTTVNPATLTIFEAGISAFEVSMDGTSINTVMIAEASGSDILYVQLASQPAANVVIGVASSDTNEGTVDMAALTFTTANWNTRQAVTVTAVPDEIDRDDSFMVNFMVTTGDGANYTTSLALSVAVTVTDDDTADLIVDISDGVSTSETGTTDTFTVVLDSQPTANVTVTIDGLIATEHTSVPPTTLMFTTVNWATAQTITLTGVNDNVVDGDQTYNLTLTPSGGGYDSVTAATVSVTNEDDDTAELTIADMMVNENAGTATVTVTLTPAVTATGNVTVNAMTVDGTAEAGTDYTAIASQTLTFTAGTTSQTLDITISDDSIVEGSETFTVMLDTLVQPTGVTTVTITDATATVTITDNDTVGLTVVDGGGVTTSETGTTGTFTVVLDSQPTANVTVEITGLIATEHTSVPPTTLMFTTVNWATAQTITLTGVNDNVVDGDQTYNLTLTPTGGGYTGVTAATVSVTNEDDDTAELTIADMMVNENATTATVTVTLTPAVTATGNVTVNAMTVDGTAEAGTDYTAIASQTLTFTAGTTSQTLDITIRDDNIAEGSETFTVMLDTLMQPTGVTTVSIATATATVTITDNDTAPTTIALGISQPTIPETAGATTITVTATIDGTVVLPTPTVVTVSVGGGTATSGTDYTAVPNFDLTIPAESASGMATFMIDPNTSSDNGDTVMITGTAPSFTTVNPATLTIFEAGISAFEVSMDGTSINTVMIAEASGNDILYVQLASQPAANVVIGVASSDTNEGTVNMATLTFTTANWNTRQAVTVTAVPDEIDRDDSFMVDFMVTTGDGANYTTSLALSVAVTVTDDDTAGIALFDMDSGTNAPTNITTTEGFTSDSFYVALTSEPTGTVTVTISGLVLEEHTFPPFFGTTLTFTPTGATAWNTRQEIKLIGVDDVVVDGNQTYDLTLTASGGGYDSVMAPTVSVTNEDDDTAELTIADMMVNEDAGTATVTVTLTPAVTATGNVTVNAMTVDGTAEAGTDYTAIASQTLTFTAGTTSQTLDITISDDNIVEGSETFTVMLDTLVQPTGVTTVSIATATATVTITDNDTAPTTIALGISQPTIPETAGATTITVTATIDGTVVLPTPTVVTVSVGGGTATSGTDYTAVPNFDLTIPAESASGMTTFMIDPNASSDNGDTVMITGTAPSFTTVTPATLTIVEAGILVYDDMSAGNQINTVMIAEASGNDILYVQLASQPAANVVIGVASSDTNEGTVNMATLTFTTGNWNMRQAVTVTAVNDNIVRDDTFTVNFAVTTGDSANYTPSLTLPSVTVTVTDDDTAGLALFDAATAGNPVTSITTGEDATATTFYVALTSEPTASVTVAVASGTTEEGQVTTGASLTFDSTNWNTPRQAVTVTGQDDNNVDGDIDYSVTLSSMSTDSNYDSLSDTTVTATNSDDDTAELTIADMMVNENATTAMVTVTLSAMVTTGDVMVNVTTADGTATAGEDYTPIPTQTLTFAAGDTSETLDITISDDNIAEGSETFTVMLGGLVAPTGVTIATDDTATVTITDDETAPTAITLSVNPSTVAETAGATTITVTAILDGTVVLPTPTVVTVSVGGGTATSGTDIRRYPTLT